MRILVTGGAGFIGSHLSDCLLAEGHHQPRLRRSRRATKAGLGVDARGQGSFPLADRGFVQPVEPEPDTTEEAADSQPKQAGKAGQRK